MAKTVIVLLTVDDDLHKNDVAMWIDCALSPDPVDSTVYDNLTDLTGDVTDGVITLDDAGVITCRV